MKLAISILSSRSAVIVLAGAIFLILQESQCAPQSSHRGCRGSAEKIVEITNLLTTFRLVDRIPGLGSAVLHLNTSDGDLLHAQGFGFRDRDLQLEANNNTLFSIGSNSKAFSACIIIKILSEKFPELGESVIDTPIVRLAPEFNLTLSDRFRTEFVTFRDILAMRVCVGGYGFNEIFSASPTKEDFYFRIRYQGEICGFRNGLAYSNALYGMAGEIAAHISGSTVEKIIRGFLDELGMQDSTFFDTEGEYETLPNMSKAYYKRLGVIRQFNNKLLKRVASVPTAGGILTTPADMLKYMSFILNKGRIEDKQIIQEEVMGWLTKNSNPFLDPTFGSDRKAGLYGYGLGFMLGLIDGHFFFGHGGFYPPFNSKLTIIPSLQIGIFTVSNGNGVTGMDSGVTHELIHGRILQVLTESSTALEIPVLGTPISNRPHFFSSPVEIDIRQLNSAVKSNEDLQEVKVGDWAWADEGILGLYGNPEEGDLIVKMSEDGQQLLIEYGEYGLGILTPTAVNSTYSISWTSDVMHQFYAYGDLVIVRFSLRLRNPNQIELEIGSNLSPLSSFLPYTRNATLDTFPVIPWEKDSCGPSTI